MSDSRHIVCPHCNGINRVPTSKLDQGGKCGKCHQPLFSAKPLIMDQTLFNQHANKSDIPLLVDFWAPWCGPCKMMAPVFEQAATQLEPQMRLGKVNTEEQQQLAAQFGIRSIPTLAIFLHGKELDRMAGAMDITNLIRWAKQPR